MTPGAEEPRPSAPKVLMFPTIQSMQRRHFLLLDVLPFLGALLALPVLVRTGVLVSDIWISALMWLLTVIGIEIGYHRYFSHKAFKTSEFMKGLLTILASMGGQGPVISWAATHRHHHEFSDQPEDSHSPLRYGPGLFAGLKGFVFAQLLWKREYPFPNPALYARGLVNDPLISRLSKHYFSWVMLGLFLPALLGGLLRQSWSGALAGFFLGGVLRLFVCQQGTFLINSAGHLWGSQPFQKGDGSRNNFWFFLPTLGGSWHNNHHAFPFVANNSLHWRQPDPSYWIICVWEKLGWVWDVRRASREKV